MRTAEGSSDLAVTDPRDEDGVDRSLCRWMLSLTPTERLDAVEGSIALLASVRPLVS